MTRGTAQGVQPSRSFAAWVVVGIVFVSMGGSAYLVYGVGAAVVVVVILAVLTLFVRWLFR